MFNDEGIKTWRDFVDGSKLSHKLVFNVIYCLVSSKMDFLHSFIASHWNHSVISRQLGGPKLDNGHENILFFTWFGRWQQNVPPHIPSSSPFFPSIPPSFQCILKLRKHSMLYIRSTRLIHKQAAGNQSFSSLPTSTDLSNISKALLLCF